MSATTVTDFARAVRPDRRPVSAAGGRVPLRLMPGPPLSELPDSCDQPVALEHAEDRPAAASGPADSAGRWVVEATCARCNRSQLVDVRQTYCPACGWSGRGGQRPTARVDGWMADPHESQPAAAPQARRWLAQKSA